MLESGQRDAARVAGVDRRRPSQLPPLLFTGRTARGPPENDITGPHVSTQ